MMTLQEIADALVSGCREGRETENLATLYADDAVSIEAASFGGQPREARGVEAIRGKHDWWAANFETHATSVDGPYLHGDDRFAVVFGIDTTSKADGTRTQMQEIAVYYVAGGRITREEFFSPTG